MQITERSTYHVIPGTVLHPR